jgi:hypothetical protein
MGDGSQAHLQRLQHAAGGACTHRHAVGRTASKARGFMSDGAASAYCSAFELGKLRPGTHLAAASAMRLAGCRWATSTPLSMAWTISSSTTHRSITMARTFTAASAERSFSVAPCCARWVAETRARAARALLPSLLGAVMEIEHFANETRSTSCIGVRVHYA